MAEKLYTIPVNDAFNKNCECAVCEMYKTLEKEALEFTLGPSYMEEDIREMTDEAGFCREHSRKMYEKGNRLGMALMYQTHTWKVIKELEGIKPETKGGFLKKADNTKLCDYVKKFSQSCFICNKIDNIFNRYLVTIMYLWDRDEEFRDKLKNSKGFCVQHYGLLVEYASKELSGKKQEEFMSTVKTIFIENMKRVKEDLDWFIDKFDYRYKNEPWKNSKDALPRMINKINSINIGEEEATE